MLTEDQRRALLALARAAVTSAVTGVGSVEHESLDLPDASGVFVTLKREGQLRGCIGTIRPRQRLAAEVVRSAADSALRDPRFPPVEPAELADLDLEISVLGPFERIDPRPDGFIIGVHGLVAEQNGRRGLLLPQVATEWGWSAALFLRHTCLKAGLAPDAWQHGAAIYRFPAEVFGEACHGSARISR